VAGYSEKHLPPIFAQFRERTEAWLHKNVDRGFNNYGEGGGPDYFLALCGTQIEVKNSERDGTLTDGPTDLQRKLLDQHGGYIFLEMFDEGYPPRPAGADAYLVPWEIYRDWWDDVRVARKISLRRTKTNRSEGVDWYLGKYKLPWQDGHWVIPQYHPSDFWMDMLVKLQNVINWLMKGELGNYGQ
jgi:hypothetical protein